ncbi:MAG: SGNH/GDSL hydrolase family protein [Gemmatimonadaceae bacterium]
MRRNGAAVLGLVAVMLGACTDGTAPTAAAGAPRLSSDEGRGDFHRYVALGTSISMGWASNGVYFGTQQTAWPVQLAAMAHRDMALPLIEDPGCTSPIVAPLALARRRSGESVAGSTVCAPNAEGVVLPADNVGIANILAHEALTRTPEMEPNRPWFARVLPPGTTALQAALAQNAKVITVEYGGNEVLQATRGLFRDGVTTVPPFVFKGAMTQILDAVGGTSAKVLVVGLPATAGNLPSLRRAAEIWAAAPAFAALNVTVAADCDASTNWMNVSTKALAAIYTGQTYKSMGLPISATLSCADVPGTLDDVLTADDMTALTARLADLNAFLEAQAASRGFAYSSIGALYDRADLKIAYNPILQLTSMEPYGHHYSLDAVHPSAAGHALIAEAAAAALNATYNMNIPTGEATVLASLGR